MIKHKKVTRIVLAGFMALCLFMGPLASKPEAATANSGHGTFTQGSYNWVYGAAGSEIINVGVSGMVIRIRLNAVYNGILTITISGISSFADVGYAVVGAQINTTSLNQIQLQLYQSQDIEVYVISNKPYNSSQTWTVSVSGTNMTNLGTELTSLRTISSAITSTTNGLPAIHNDLDSIEQAIDDLQAYIDQIEGYIDNIEPTLNQIEAYANNLNYIMRFNNVEPWQYNALCWPWYNNGSNVIQYSYERGLIYFNYDTSNNNGAYYDPKCIKIPAYGHLGFYFYTSQPLTSSDVKIYASNNNVDLSGMVLQNNFFQSGAPYYKQLIHFENKQNSYIYISLEFTKNTKVYPLFLGNISNTPDEVADLYGIEYGNTYTRLMTATNTGLTTINNTLNGLKSQTITNTDRIVTALQNLQQQVIVNQNSQTVIDMSTNTTNTINQQFQTINNVELNILDGIGTKFNNVTTAIDNSGVISGSVNNTGIGWANYYSGIVLDNLTIVKYPVYIILIGFVLLCLLG